MASTVLPNGIIIPEKFSRDWYADLYHNWQELDNLLGGGTPKDGTLTIQKNGSTVGTFSANQATDETINITVPAKTSDLTNDSGFITEDTTKIPLAGSNAISGDLIPSSDGTVNLGGSSYQWNNAYIKSLTINGVAAGDILTHNASEFVNVTSNQTIGGIKTFSDGIDNKNVQRFIFNKEYNDTTNSWLDIHRYFDKNSTRIGFYSIGDFGGNRSFRWFVRGQSTNSVEADIFGFGRKINETSYMYINATLETDLIPTNNNSKSLGTSTNKWKSLNGINPGALSLPGDAYIDIDTTNYAWGSNFTFTPNYDGYCFLSIGSSSYSRKISLKTGRGEYYFSNQTDVFCFTFPVYKGKLVTILTNSSGTESVIPTIRVFSCQGNV